MNVLYQTRIQKERFQDRWAVAAARSCWYTQCWAEQRAEWWRVACIGAAEQRYRQPITAVLPSHTSSMLPSTALRCCPAARPDDYDKAKGKYIINGETLKRMKQDAIVMHPLPRVDEVRDPPRRGSEQG